MYSSVAKSVQRMCKSKEDKGFPVETYLLTLETGSILEGLNMW